MSKFENSGHELSDAELSTVQGGGLGSWLKGAINTVGNAIGEGVKAVGNAISDGAQAIATGLTNIILADAKRRLRDHGFPY